MNVKQSMPGRAARSVRAGAPVWIDGLGQRARYTGREGIMALRWQPRGPT